MNDIEPHLPHPANLGEDFMSELRTLKKYASQCESVAEFGTFQCYSTWALLAGKPKKLTTYDIGITSKPCPGQVGAVESEVNRVAQAAAEYGILFEFKLGNTAEIPPIDPVDMLFIDSCHTLEHVTKELVLHADKVKKFLAFHDTTIFAFHDEYRPASNAGLWPAIEALIAAGEWALKERLHTCNGVTVLERCT